MYDISELNHIISYCIHQDFGINTGLMFLQDATSRRLVGLSVGLLCSSSSAPNNYPPVNDQIRSSVASLVLSLLECGNATLTCIACNLVQWIAFRDVTDIDDLAENSSRQSKVFGLKVFSSFGGYAVMLIGQFDFQHEVFC